MTILFPSPTEPVSDVCTRFRQWFEQRQTLPLERLSELYHPQARLRDPEGEIQGLSAIEERIERRLQLWSEYRLRFLDQNCAESGISYLKWDLLLPERQGHIILRGMTQLHHCNQGRHILYQEDIYDRQAIAAQQSSKSPRIQGLWPQHWPGLKAPSKKLER